MRKFVLISCLLLFKNGFGQSFQPPVLKYGDVVINELLADPTPVTGLPPAEFTELLNTTDHAILLKGWKYEDLSTHYIFDNDTIAPHAYVILCARADTAAFTPFGKTIGLKTWPALNNTGDLLTLTASNGMVIDVVSYKDTWYNEAVKKQGGYSLERTDPLSTCQGMQNWLASISPKGGTPGMTNSVYSETSTVKPALIAAEVIDSNTLSLTFNKYLDSSTAALVQHYVLNNSIGHPVVALPQPPWFTRVILKLSEGLKRGLLNYLTVTDVSDCAGNLTDDQAALFLPEKIKPGDVLISEVLFNPPAGGTDYVEVYNASGYILDLKDLQLSAGLLAEARELTSKTYLIQPDAFCVLTASPENVKANYYVANAENFITMKLPALKVASGNITLLSNLQIIDQFNYSEEMHVPLLKEAKGVALERCTFAQPAGQPGNFTSASATAGYGTPTYRNSVSDGDPGKEGMMLAAELFSPDNDGTDDLLEINYHFNSPGKMGTLGIYDDKGQLKRQLIKNGNLGTTGKLTWDGLDDKGRLCSAGIYIVFFQVFNLQGKAVQYKKACILAQRFK